MLPKNFFVNWYLSRGRQFPWREENTSPFAIMVTEMLLRQTRAAGVAKLWKELMKKYPNPRALGSANKESLKNLIGILGFGRMRSQALVMASNFLLERHGGAVPESVDSLLKIPHIGRYAAHAVLCFGFGHDIEVVDGNVLRFFSRYNGLKVKPDIRRNPHVTEIAKSSLPRGTGKAALHNYGLLDFTAEICRPIRPLCGNCSLAKSCQFRKSQIIVLRRNSRYHVHQIKVRSPTIPEPPAS